MGEATTELLGAGYRPLPCRWPSTASARRHLERRAHPFPGDRRLLDTRLMKPGVTVMSSFHGDFFSRGCCCLSKVHRHGGGEKGGGSRFKDGPVRPRMDS